VFPVSGQAAPGSGFFNHRLVQATDAPVTDQLLIKIQRLNQAKFAAAIVTRRCAIQVEITGCFPQTAVWVMI
jgi:hypothetical protein